MPEYKYSTGWDSYDYGGCKCYTIISLYKEISRIDVAIDDVDDLKTGYNDIHDMYSDIINETEAALYIKDEKIVSIKNKVTETEDNNTSNLKDCINYFNLSLQNKEQRVFRLEEIDDKYHRED
jgi:hypothetical protein